MKQRKIKYLLLSIAMVMAAGQAQATTWTTSADIRERYQFYDNLNFNSAVDNNSWEFDSRLYIKAKADFNNGLTAFVQSQAVMIQNHTVANGTQNFTQADLLQAYIQYNVGDFGIRLGRQQLVYGDQRLLGHLGWKDVARTFDGVKGMYKSGAVAVDVFAVHPSDIGAMTPTTAVPQGESLVTWEDRRLMGVYGTYTIAPKTGIDAYAINWYHGDKAAVGPSRNMNTYGGRGFGQWGAIDATGEAVFQTGIWSKGVSQSASAYALKAGYTFDMWKTRVGIEYDYSPGDAAPAAGDHKDFVFPYHTNHAHYGEMDRFSWANMRDIRLSLQTSPARGLTFIGNVHFLSLDKATGDWLDVVGAGKLYAGNAAYTSKDAGTEIDLKVVYKVEPVEGLKLVGNYSIFNPGKAVAERNGGKADSASFGYLMASYQF